MKKRHQKGNGNKPKLCPETSHTIGLSWPKGWEPRSTNSLDLQNYVIPRWYWAKMQHLHCRHYLCIL